MNSNSLVHVFLDEKKNPTLWIKRFIWHKYMNKTPRGYADSMVRILKLKGEKAKKEYGPCFWGSHEESPEKHGYTFAGVIKDSGDPCQCEHCK